MARGLTISDLHLFTRRTGITDLIQTLPGDIDGVRHLVLNGDIFDFRWTTLPDVGKTVEKALACILDLMGHYPDLEIHYILGNHDCHHKFITQLQGLEKNRALFFLHPYFLHMGDLLFLHGDCANRYIRHEHFIELRKSWMNASKRPDIQAVAYEMADNTGITRLLHYLYFPKREIARRILYYLNSLPQGIPKGTKEIYMGHSHIPFSGYKFKNYCFHNTGSGIKGMTLSPLYFVP